MDCKEKCTECKKDRVTLKGFFSEGRTPGAQQFEYFIQSGINQESDKVWVNCENGNLGVGTKDASSRLSVEGNLSVGKEVAGNSLTEAPENGLLVQGDVVFQSLKGPYPQLVVSDEEGRLSQQDFPPSNVEILEPEHGLEITESSPTRVVLKMLPTNGLQFVDLDRADGKKGFGLGGQLIEGTYIEMDQNPLSLTSGMLPRLDLNGAGDLRINGSFVVNAEPEAELRIGNNRFNPRPGAIGIGHEYYQQAGEVAFSQDIRGNIGIEASAGGEIQLKIGTKTKVRVDNDGTMTMGNYDDLGDALTVMGKTFSAYGFAANNGEFAVLFQVVGYDPNDRSTHLKEGQTVIFSAQEEGKVQPALVPATNLNPNLVTGVTATATTTATASTTGNVTASTTTTSEVVNDPVSNDPTNNDPVSNDPTNNDPVSNDPTNIPGNNPTRPAPVIGVVVRQPAFLGGSYRHDNSRYNKRLSEKLATDPLVTKSLQQTQLADQPILKRKKKPGAPQIISKYEIKWDAQEQRHVLYDEETVTPLIQDTITGTLYRPDGTPLDGLYELPIWDNEDELRPVWNADGSLGLEDSDQTRFQLPVQKASGGDADDSLILSTQNEYDESWYAIALFGVVPVEHNQPKGENWVFIKTLNPSFDLYLVR